MYIGLHLRRTESLTYFIIIISSALAYSGSEIEYCTACNILYTPLHNSSDTPKDAMRQDGLENLAKIREKNTRNA